MWLFITAARGPVECQIACARLVAIICKEAKQSGIDSALLEDHEGEHGLLSALIALDGDTEAFATSWEGTVQWTCPSSLRNTKRKNWFVSVSVIRPPEPLAVFRESDLKFESFRSSGPGGQHVQKTDSAVRVTHIPTAMVAQAQEERSQYRNKALAVARLAAMFTQRDVDAKAAVETEKWSRHDTIERGNPTRIYRGTEFHRS